MIKKLSEIQYKIDINGTVTVPLGGETVLKISPLDVLILAEKVIELQSQQTKMETAVNVYTSVLLSLGFPQEVIEKAKNKLTEEEKTIDTPAVTVEDPIEIEEVPTEDRLFDFVSSFVNKTTPENEFEWEEFNSVCDLDKEQIKNLIESYGFNTKVHTNSIVVSWSPQ